MPDQIVFLLSKRREYAQLLQQLQHVVPALPLLMQGLTRLTHEGHFWSLVLGAAEVGISAVVLVAFIRTLRGRLRSSNSEGHGDGDASGHGAHAAHAAHAHGVDWVDIFLGAMLGIEVWAHWFESGHIKRPTVLLALVMVAVGLLHGKIAALGNRRRALRIGDQGISIGNKFGARFRLNWDEIASIDITDRTASIAGVKGRSKKINLADLKNAAEVRSALLAARARLSPVAEPEVTEPA